MQDVVGAVQNQNKKRGLNPTFLRITLPAVLLAASVVCLITLPAVEYLSSFLEWARQLSSWSLGPFILAITFAAAAVVPIPGSVLAAACGFLFGPFIGTIAAWTGATVGAAVAFSLGRSIARNWVAARISGNRRLVAIDAAVGTQGFKVILLLRLSSVIPFALLSYAMGLTRASFWQHALASWIGMFPVIFAYVYLGSMAGSLADVISGRLEGGHVRIPFLCAGILGVVVIVLLISRIASRALRVPDPAKDFNAL